jgi:hypothetical protein
VSPDISPRGDLDLSPLVEANRSPKDVPRVPVGQKISHVATNTKTVISNAGSSTVQRDEKRNQLVAKIFANQAASMTNGDLEALYSMLLTEERSKSTFAVTETHLGRVAIEAFIRVCENGVIKKYLFYYLLLCILFYFMFGLSLFAPVFSVFLITSIFCTTSKWKLTKS